MLKTLAGAMTGALMTVSMVAAAEAATTKIKATLWDKGAGTPMATDRGYGMPDGKTPPTMGIKLSKVSAKAGDVLFDVTNSSKDTIHEMVILPLKDGEKFPYSDKDGKIDEEAAGHLGEVSELGPGKKGSVKIGLKPGKYLLVCNIAGHYMAGMWSVFTVK